MPIIEISSLTDSGVEIFSTLTEAQLRNRIEPDKGLFIAESPKSTASWNGWTRKTSSNVSFRSNSTV